MSKLRINNILRTALESQDGEQFDVVTPETVTEVERELIELDETHEEARAAVEVVEELEERHEQVEELEEALESFNRDGGMSRDAAVLYQMRLQQLTAGLESVPGCSYVTVSVESFGGTGGRLAASLEQAEKTKAAKDGIWQTIMRMLRAVKDAIVNFFGRLTSSNVGIKKKAEELKQKASSFRGEVSGEGTITGGTWARNLAAPNGAVTPAATPKLLKDLGSALTDIQVAANTLVSNPTTTSFDAFNNKLRAIDSKLPGSYQVAVNGDRVDITRAEVKSPEQIEKLSNRQVSDVAGSVVEIVRHVETFSKNIKGAMDKLDKTAAAMAKQSDSKEDSEHANAIRKAIPAIRRAALELPKIASDAARAALVYCGKSMNKVTQDNKAGEASLKSEIMKRRELEGKSTNTKAATARRDAAAAEAAKK